MYNSYYTPAQFNYLTTYMAQRTSSRSSRDFSSADDASVTSASEAAARVFGVIFILVGLVLIVLLVGGFITSKLPYRVDPTLPIPTLDAADKYTNEEATSVTGTALPGEKVVLYIDDERTNTTVETDEDGVFAFDDIALQEEGEVSFSSAVIRGGLFKRRSELSNTVATTVDWTAPSSAISFEYDETSNSDKVTIKGTADPDTIVVLGTGDKKFEATVDDEGIFTFVDVPLVAGSNSFSVRIKDLAGNEVQASKQVEIAYAVGDLNGNGASTTNISNLPESAGELEAAMEFLRGNSVMFAIAVVVLCAFGASASSAYLYSKRSVR
jgi:hypothetical protein